MVLSVNYATSNIEENAKKQWRAMSYNQRDLWNDKCIGKFKWFTYLANYDTTKLHQTRNNNENWTKDFIDLLS